MDRQIDRPTNIPRTNTRTHAHVHTHTDRQTHAYMRKMIVCGVKQEQNPCFCVTKVKKGNSRRRVAWRSAAVAVVVYVVVDVTVVDACLMRLEGPKMLYSWLALLLLDEVWL